MKDIKWQVKEVAPGMVRIEPGTLANLPTLEEYKKIAMDLLLRGKPDDSEDKLKDESNNRDISDSLLLRTELSHDKFRTNANKIHEVVFSYKSQDILVNSKNINSVFEELKTLQEPKIADEYMNPNVAEEMLK